MDGNAPREKRLVRSGEQFTSDELRDGLIELERVQAAPEPPEERSHPAEIPEGRRTLRDMLFGDR